MEKCTLCPLHACTPLPCEGRYLSPKVEGKKRKIMIITDSPHDNDYFTRSFFADSRYASDFAALMKAAKFKPEDIYLTGLVKCTPKIDGVLKEVILKSQYINACNMYLQVELAQVQPEYLILFGEKVFSYFHPDLSFTDNRGKMLDCERFHAKTFATYNPTSMAFTNKFDKIIYIDMKKAASLIYNFEEQTTTEAEKSTKDYRFPLKSLDILRSLAKKLKEVDTFAFDIETHGKGLFNYKLLSIGFSYKEHTGVSVPVWVRDQAKVDALQKVMDYEIPKRSKKVESGVLKNGSVRYKTVAVTGIQQEDRDALKAFLPTEYHYITDLPKLGDMKRAVRTILDKEPPLKKYWGDQHDECMDLIKEIMENDTPKGAHNGSYDVNRLRGIGINVKNYAWDTILMHHLLDEERPHGLDELSAVYTKDGGYKSEKNKYLNSTLTSWANIPTDVLLPYNAQDADVTLQLYHIFIEKMEKEPKLLNLFYKQTMPAQHMLIDMSFRGSYVDMDWLNKTQTEYRQRMHDLKIEFQQLVNRVMPNVYVVDGAEEARAFKEQWDEEHKDDVVKPEMPQILNMNSNKQLVELFRDYYHIKMKKKTATGDALDAKVLKKMAKSYPAAKILLEYKALYKLDSTYLTGVKEAIDADGKIHTEFLLYGTVTGRLSSRNINCFDNQTEVLTKSGFKLFKDLSKEDLVAQWKDGEITFAKPLEYIKNRYTGKLLHIHNKHIDICGTPDHRCLLEAGNTKKRITVPLSKYQTNCKQFHGGNYAGGSLSFNHDELRLLVATQADGYYTGSGIDFSFKKKRKIERFTALLNRLNIVVEPKKKVDGGTRFYLGKDLPVVKWIYSMMPTKEFPLSFIDLTAECREVFLNELTHWDGSYTCPIMYCSKSKQNVDLVQTLLTLSSRRTAYRERTLPRCGEYRTYYYVDSCKDVNFSWTTYAHKEEVDYDDYVYCVTMPNDTVIVRRNGCVIMTHNCQNQPKETKFMFIPPKGYVCVNVDQSAAELHVLAWMANDRKMIRIFEDRRDLHRETAAGVFGKKPEDITDEERKIAKRVSFGTAYSISGTGLAELLEPEGVKISASQGDKYIKKWRETYKSCAKFLDNSKSWFTRYKRLQNPFGRIRHKYKVFADNSKESTSQRQACNYPIQSTASDIQIYEMVQMYPTLIENGVLPVFTVHDSIVMYCPYDKLEWLRDYYKQCTCRRFNDDEFNGLHGCLMYTEMEVGRNYGEHVKLPYDCDFAAWKEENKFLFDNPA